LNFKNKYNYKQIVSRINTDDYYYDRSKEVIKAGSFAEFAKNYDLDVPAAFELNLLKSHIEQLVLGNEVWLPKYDMSGTAKRYDNYILAKPNKIIISEGLFNLSNGINDVFDFCIYVDVDSEEQKNRFYQRAAQRGLGDAAKQVYNNAVSKAEVHVKPTSKNADVIINGMADRSEYKKVANELLEIVNSLQKAQVC
jgi:uridine kinase